MADDTAIDAETAIVATSAVETDKCAAEATEATAVIINELINGFPNHPQKDILLAHLINLAAESLSAFSTDELKSLYSLSLKMIKVSAAKSSSNSGEMVDLCLSLLCNLTVPEENAQLLLDANVTNTTPVGEPSITISISSELTLAIESYLSYDCQLLDSEQLSPTSEEWARIDPWQHMASVLCNIARLEDGRRVLLRQSTGYIQKLILQIRSKNPTRRRGAVGALRSCLFDKDIHWWMLFEVGVLPHLLLPLVVATPFTAREKEGMDPLLFLNAEDPEKKWEPEMDILLMLLECIVLLCQRRGIREELRRKKVYPICRNLDYLQENETASELVLDVVNLLMRDEDDDTPIDRGDPDSAFYMDSSAKGVGAGDDTSTVFSMSAVAPVSSVNATTSPAKSGASIAVESDTSSSGEGFAGDDFINSVD